METRQTSNSPAGPGHRIHVFGASGSGTSTLGRALADRIGGRHLDADDYYWLATDPPFTHTREPAERIAMIQRDAAGAANWVLSGSICGWGDPLIHRFTVAVFVHLDPATRMARLSRRERDQYGARILPGGDLYPHHRDFMDWARSYDHATAPVRSLDLHERWMAGMACPVLRVDSGRPLAGLCDEILARLAASTDRPERFDGA